MDVLVEGMQQNLQTAARFYTEQNDLIVKFSNTTSTDMKKHIYLHHFRNEIIPGIPAEPAECWVSMKAGCAHESAHIIFSHRRAWERACSKGKLFQHIVNIIEDARIEKAVSNMYPGTKLWLRFTNEYIFKNRKFSSSGLRGFLEGVLCYAVVGLVPEGMDDKVNAAIEDCMDYVDEARNAESTWKVLEYAEKINEIALKVFPSLESMEKPEGFKGSDNPMPAPSGDEDPRRVVKKKSKSKKKSSKEEKDSKDKESESKGGKGKDKPEEKPESPDTEKPSGDSKDPEKPDEKPDEASSGSGEKPEEKSEEPDKSGETEKPEEKSDEESDENEKSDEAGNSEEEPEETKEDEKLDSSSEETGESEDDEPEDTEPEDTGESEEFDEPEDAGEPEEAGDESEKETPFPGDDPEEEFSEDDYPDTIPDDDPEMEELLETAETELYTIEVDAERKVKAAEAEEPDEVDYDKLSKELSKEAAHFGVGFQLRQKEPNPMGYQRLLKMLSGPIKNLVEEIRKSLEFRDSVPRRCLKKGHLDPGALWKIRVPSPEVFFRKEEPGDVPELAVELLVDCSGSMGCVDTPTPESTPKIRMDAAIEAAVVLHETCNRLKIQHSVVGFTSYDYERIKVTHYKVVDWNEPDGTKIASLGAESENRDGYSIRVSTSELEMRPEQVKLLIVLSDGMPLDHRYVFGDVGLPDTIRAVRDAEKKGIKVIGIYFGPEDSLEHAKKIYNYLVYCKDINSLPAILGRVLKKVLLG